MHPSFEPGLMMEPTFEPGDIVQLNMHYFSFWYFEEYMPTAFARILQLGAFPNGWPAAKFLIAKPPGSVSGPLSWESISAHHATFLAPLNTHLRTRNVTRGNRRKWAAQSIQKWYRYMRSRMRVRHLFDIVLGELSALPGAQDYDKCAQRWDA